MRGGLAVLAAVVFTGCAAATSTSEPVHELTFSVPADLVTASESAAAEWNDTCGYRLRTADDGAFRVLWAHNVGGDSFTLAYTSVADRTIELDADKLVGYDHDAIVEIVTHEMGHAIGWMHSEDDHDVMYRALGTKRRHVAATDCAL